MSRMNHVRRGLGIVEALIALSITAALLTAVGAAFTASAKAMTVNDEFFRSTQAARVALQRILWQVRNGSVDDTSAANSLHLITNTVYDDLGNIVKQPQDVTYKLVTESDPTKGPMRLVMVNNTNNQTYELAKNVTTAISTTSPFVVELGQDYNHTTCVSRVSVVLAVKVGTNEVLVSGAAAPRRNMAY